MTENDHYFLVTIAKQWGLFYLMFLSAGVLVYAFWKGNKKRFDHAACSILEDEKGPKA